MVKLIQTPDKLPVKNLSEQYLQKRLIMNSYDIGIEAELQIRRVKA